MGLSALPASSMMRLTPFHEISRGKISFFAITFSDFIAFRRMTHQPVSLTQVSRLSLWLSHPPGGLQFRP